MTRLTASREVEFRAPADPPGRVLGEQRLAELPTGHPARDRVLAHLLSAEDGIDVSLADVLERRSLDVLTNHVRVDDPKSPAEAAATVLPVSTS